MAWMRHKPDDEPGSPTDHSSDSPSRSPQPRSSAPPPPAPRESGSTGKNVNIGPSVHIKGTLAGREDLTVDGRVEGKISLKEHVLTIGANGRIDAELQAKAVVVYGKVTGNVTADHKVEVASSGTLQGDIRSPRVSIADGAMFKGSIDMDVGSQAARDKPGVSKGATTEMPQASKVAS